MPLHKVTDFLSEISAFFRKNDAHKAMYSILDVIKWLRMNESTLFGMKSKCNNVYPLLQVFQALLLYPCFMVRNPYRFTGSSLSGLLGCQKDVFYRIHEQSQDKLAEVRLSPHPPALVEDQTPFWAQGRHGLPDSR